MTDPLQTVLQYVFALDNQAVQFVVAARGPLVTKVMTSVTGLGSATAALVFAGLFYLAGWRREFREAAAALPVAGAVVGGLMWAVQRAFPPQPVCLTSGTETVAHSFPSGHAAAVMIFATIAHDSEELPFLPVAGLALVVAVSRVYLGTHFLSDTLFGMGVGVGAVLVARWALARFADTATDGPLARFV
jgi:membrane-associated phospholipid phosphatase